MLLLFFLGPYLAMRNISKETVISRVFFGRESGIFKLGASAI